jgi:hypothetical protein
LSTGFSIEASAIEQSRTESPDWPLLARPLGVAQHAVEGDPRGTIALEVKPQVYVDTSRGGDQITLKPELFVRASDVLRRGAG